MPPLPSKIPAHVRPRYWIGETVYCKNSSTSCTVVSVELIGSPETPAVMYHLSQYVDDSLQHLDAYEIELTSERQFTTE